MVSEERTRDKKDRKEGKILTEGVEEKERGTQTVKNPDN